MLEKDLESLRNLVPTGPLDGLEAAVWEKVEAESEVARLRHIVLGCQAGAVVLMVMGSVLLGNLTPRNTDRTRGLGAFSIEGIPAPSTLLLGAHT